MSSELEAERKAFAKALSASGSMFIEHATPENYPSHWSLWQAARSQPATSTSEKPWQKSCPDFPNCPNIACPCEPKGASIQPAAPRVVSDDIQVAMEGVKYFTKYFSGKNGDSGDREYLRAMRAALESIAPQQPEFDGTSNPHEPEHEMPAQRDPDGYITKRNDERGMRVAYKTRNECNNNAGECEPYWLAPQPAQPSVPVEALKALADKWMRELRTASSWELNQIIAAHDGKGEQDGEETI